MIKQENGEWCVYKHGKDGELTKVRCYPSEAEAKKAKDELVGSGEYALENYDINGVEIFATGVHNGDRYDERDLDDIVAAFRALDFKPPLKSGHTRDEPGMPALGFVANLRRQGEKLVADFVNMPKIVHDYIQARRFDTVSSEIWWNLKRGASTFRRALKAVALLGADIPAVAGLRPLHELFSAEAGEVHTAEAIKLLSTEGTTTKGNSMTPEELKALQDKHAAELAARDKKIEEMTAEARKHAEASDAATKAVAELTARFEALAKGAGNIDDVRRNALVAEAEANAKQARAAQEAAEAAAKAERAAREAAETAAKADREKVAKLEEDARRGRIDKLVASVKVPALRKFFAQYADLATRIPEGETVVHVFDEHGGKHTALSQLEDAIKLVNADTAKLFKVYSKEDPLDGRQPDSPDMEVDKLTRAYMHEHDVKDYAKAMKAVLDQNPALKEAYAKRQKAA